MQTSPGGLFRAACFLQGTGGDSAISQVYFGPAMVREEVVNFKLKKALYDMGQAVVDTGGAESMSAFVGFAVSNQVGVDLMALNAGVSFAVRECRTEYSRGRGSDWRMVSVRVHSALLQSVDVLIREGAAENRSEYFRRAFAEEIRRDRKRTLGLTEDDVRRIFREEQQKYLQRQLSYVSGPGL